MIERPDLSILMRLTTDVMGETDASAWLLVDTGFGSIVYEVCGWIVRVARNSDVQRGHELERQLLPTLHRRVSVPVPSGSVLISPDDGLPFGALVYRALPGRPMRVEDGASWPKLAIEVADALVSIHTVPVSEVERLGVPRANLSAESAAIREVTESVLDKELDPGLRGTLAAWWNTTVREPLSFRPVLCHGDPWYGNLLVDLDGSHLAGLLDFERAVISDPAVDLAATFHLGQRFGEAAVSHYLELRGTDPDLPTRVERHRLLRELAGLSYLLRHDYEEELPGSVAKVRAALRTVLYA